MRNISLSTADKIYNCVSSFKIERHIVNHTKFRDYCLTLRKFERLLGNEVEDSFWKIFIQRLRRYRFEMCAAPLPFNHPAVYTPKLIDIINKAVSDCRMVYPSFVSALEELAGYIKRLAESGSNPLLEFLNGFFGKNDNRSTVLLLKESRLIPFAEKVLFCQPSLRNIGFVNIHQLRGETCYQKIIIIGPAYWYPEYIFSAPRASEIHIIHYKWIRDKWEPRPVFVSVFNNQDQVTRYNYKYDQSNAVDEAETLSIENYLDSDDLLPEVNWEEISARFSRSTSNDTASIGQDIVDAKLFLLEGGTAVLLDEDTKVLVIDLDEDEGDDEKEETRVKRIQASGIQPGMYILLRTCGGGEYIVPVADRILGVLAPRARESQRHWKTLLQESVYSRGLQEVVDALRTLGCARANEVNVRNWMSMRNIRPQAYQDFAAIMKFVKLEDRTEEYWKLAGAIDDSHKKAGFYIRKLLLKQVLTVKLDDLEKTGRMDFELPEADGGSLTAFRVIDVSPGKYTVPVTRIGHPFERDDDGNGENDPTLYCTGMQ